MRIGKTLIVCAILGAGVFGAGLVGCATAPRTAEDRASLEDDAHATLERFLDVDPSMRARFVDPAVGYAIFPSVGKGGVIVGGAYGRGTLYEDGRITGYCDLTQGSIGFQLGGQVYSEIIFFRSDTALRSFKNGDLEFAAQASAVAVTADASANASYENDVAVFTLAGKGLMYEASIGGQRFTFEPK